MPVDDVPCESSSRHVVIRSICHSEISVFVIVGKPAEAQTLRATGALSRATRADDFKLGTRLAQNKLIYHVLYSSLVFAVVLICFHIIEGAAVASLRGRPLADALADFGAGNLRGVLSYGAIAFVTLIPFFLFRGIARAVGEAQLWQLIFARGERTFTLVAQE